MISLLLQKKIPEVFDVLSCTISVSIVYTRGNGSGGHRAMEQLPCLPPAEEVAKMQRHLEMKLPRLTGTGLPAGTAVTSKVSN